MSQKGKKSMKIMKFGGSSLGSGTRITHVAEIVKEYKEKDDVILVVSAMSGVTDTLIHFFQAYKKSDQVKTLELNLKLYELHMSALHGLKLSWKKEDELREKIKTSFDKVVDILRKENEQNIWLNDYVISLGERLSALLVSHALEKIGVNAQSVCSSQVIVTTKEFGNASANLLKTKKKVAEEIVPLLLKNIVPVVTGFYGATEKGNIATLGRGGSDYSATILAHALNADEVILWKEVDGVFSEDPKIHKSAQFISELSYEYALKLAQDGAKILHPEAMRPVQEKEIVVWVKNTFNPKFKGSKIWKGKNEKL